MVVDDEVDVRSAVTSLLGQAGATVVCLDSGVNIAQLLLARSDARLREFAMRKAIGARSSRLFRLALFESLLLSLNS